MKTIYLGDGKTCPVDLDKLIASRLLIQANSGGGKSHTIRRLLEQTHGKVQQIVLDPEGEFSTLRERFDYVLVGTGKGVDIQVEARSAALLARKLLETGASAIIDLYELHAQERKHFVKLFLDAMVNSPKELWHDVLVVLDEAHVFCPEAGQAESASAVNDMATRGRKRGFCLVPATQRISKLHKDTAAECNNKLIGRTSLDIDMKRAGDELGFRTHEQLLSLRNLDPGCFWAYGPALGKDIAAVLIGDVVTSPPKTGKGAGRMAKPSAAIKAIVAKLGDLPKIAEIEAATIEGMKLELQQARSENSRLQRHRCPPPSVLPEKVDSLVAAAVKVQVQKHVTAFKSIENGYKNVIRQFKNRNLKLTSLVLELADTFKNKFPEIDEHPGVTYAPERLLPTAKNDVVPSFPPQNGKPAPIFPPKLVHPVPMPTVDSEGIHRSLGGRARLMASILAARPGVTRDQLALHAGLVNPSGNFSDRLSELRSRGWLEESSGRLSLRPEAVSETSGVPVPDGDQVIAAWREKLGGRARMMLDHLIGRRGETVSRADLAGAVELVNPSGNFSDRLSELRSLGLIKDIDGGVRINEDLFI